MDAPVMRVAVATSNAGKLAEIRSALALPGWTFVSVAELGLWPEVAETGDTFFANALIKAEAARERFAVAALADDSGLEVDALQGAPGVYSSRYAGEPSSDAANNAKLLEELADVPDDLRTARFRSVVVLITEEAVVYSAEGACEGRIGRDPRGSGGFGYDPLFLPDAVPGKTMAELTMDEKNSISHRGAALRALRDVLTSAR